MGAGLACDGTAHGLRLRRDPRRCGAHGAVDRHERDCRHPRRLSAGGVPGRYACGRSGAALVTTTMVLLGVFLGTLLMGVPIAFALSLGAFAVLWMMGLFVPELVVQRVFAGMDSFPIMAIPFFVLAGALMESGGISARLVRFSSALVGWITGGLGHVAVVAAMFFAGISGSAVADTAAISTTMIPMMRRKGYDPGFAAGLIASAGVIGPIIPPSIPMVLYGTIAGVSIGALFLGGIIPGVLMGLGLMLVVYLIARRKNFPKEDVKPSLIVIGRAFVPASG